MSCLPAAVSLAMIAAPVPVAAAQQPVAAQQPETTPAVGSEADTPWRCGDNQARYKPADRDAQKYWREQTGRFVAADAGRRIGILEEAWTRTKDPCFLYFLYRANERQGHYLQAYAQAQQLEAMGGRRTPADVGEFVLQVVEGSKDCDVTLKLDEAAAPTSARVQAKYDGLVEGDDLTGRCAQAPCEQALALTQKQQRQALRVGRWTLVAGQGSEFTPESAGPGEPPERRTFVVDDCGAPRSLTLRAAAPRPEPAPVQPVVVAPPVQPGAPIVTPIVTPVPTPAPRQADMRRLGNVGLAVGAGFLLGGGVVLAVGASRWRSVRGAGLDECNGDELNGTALCRDALAGATQMRTTGAGVFGAGAGVLLPALLLRRSTRAERATWLPIAGGVATVGGAVLIGVASAIFKRELGGGSTTPWGEGGAGSMHLHTVGGALTGFGVGLLGSALARCVWRGACGPRKQGTRAALELTPGRLPGGAAIAISGQF